jgi:hypothetical protein
MTGRALAAIAVALALCPVAGAHGDGAQRGFRSSVTAIAPAVEGLEVVVLDGDDRLLLTNRTGRRVEILGYDGEPYLRFEPGGGVLRNTASPATYLNEERYGGVAVPASASGDAEPRWERIGAGTSYDWHDHRIHWMSRIDPPGVRRDPDRAQRVFDWRVPATVGGERLAIAGRLDYEPPPESRFSWALVAPVVAVALAGIAAWWLRRRREARTEVRR